MGVVATDCRTTRDALRAVSRRPYGNEPEAPPRRKVSRAVSNRSILALRVLSMHLVILQAKRARLSSAAVFYSARSQPGWRRASTIGATRPLSRKKGKPVGVPPDTSGTAEAMCVMRDGAIAVADFDQKQTWFNRFNPRRIRGTGKPTLL